MPFLFFSYFHFCIHVRCVWVCVCVCVCAHAWVCVLCMCVCVCVCLRVRAVVWDFSALGSPTSSVSRRVVKLTISHYYSAPLPVQKRGYGDEI